MRRITFLLKRPFYSFVSLVDIHHTYKEIKNTTIPEINKYLEWILLFQIDADKLLDFNWADGGRIYYFIHKEELKNHNFNDVKAIAQCY